MVSGATGRQGNSGVKDFTYKRPAKLAGGAFVCKIVATLSVRNRVAVVSAMKEIFHLLEEAFITFVGFGLKVGRCF